jgi:hypothetical protein
LNHQTPWSVLGIAATRDQIEIRRAYARRLKVTQPEDDPEGFQHLRQAYEVALRISAWVDQDDEVDFEAEEAEPEPEFVVEVRSPENRVRPAPAVVGHQPVRPSTEPAPLREAAQPPASQERDEEAEHQALCDRLFSLAGDKSAEPRDVLAALEAVLHSPAMDSIAVHDRTEHWLGWLAAGESAHALVLIDPVVAHFHWSQDQLGWRPDAADAVFERRRGKVLLDSVARHDHPQHAAFKALNRPASRWRRINYRLTPRLADEVRELLGILRLNWPGVLARLDTGALAWWDAYLGRPQIKPAMIWTVPLATTVIILILLQPSSADQLAGYPAWGRIIGVAAVLALPTAAVFAWQWLIDMPRWWFANRDHDAISPWVRLGWAPAGLALVLLAGLLPATAGITVGLGVVGVAVAYWALVTGQADNGPSQDRGWVLTYLSIFTLGFWVTHFLWWPRPRVHWLARAIFAYAYLAIFWYLIRAFGPQDHWWQIGVTLATGGFAAVMGSVSLRQAWQWELTERTRSILLGLIGAGAPLAVAGLFVGQYLAWATAPSLALTGILVLAHKTLPIRRDRPDTDLIRDIVMRFGWVAIPILAVVGQARDGALWPVAVWLLSGVMITVIDGLAVRWRLAYPKARKQPAKPMAF